MLPELDQLIGGRAIHADPTREICEPMPTQLVMWATSSRSLCLNHSSRASLLACLILAADSAPSRIIWDRVGMVRGIRVTDGRRVSVATDQANRMISAQAAAKMNAMSLSLAGLGCVMEGFRTRSR